MQVQALEGQRWRVDGGRMNVGGQGGGSVETIGGIVGT